MADRIDLTEARRVAEGVTPAPWHASKVERAAWNVGTDSMHVCGAAGRTGQRDAAFIAYWRNNADAVLDELEELRAFKAKSPANICLTLLTETR